jgi:hypothetical protein
MMGRDQDSYVRQQKAFALAKAIKIKQIAMFSYATDLINLFN